MSGSEYTLLFEQALESLEKLGASLITAVVNERDATLSAELQDKLAAVHVGLSYLLASDSRTETVIAMRINNAVNGSYVALVDE